MAMILSFLPLMIGFSWLKVADFIGVHLLLLINKILDLFSELLSKIQEKQKESSIKKVSTAKSEAEEPLKKHSKKKWLIS